MVFRGKCRLSVVVDGAASLSRARFERGIDCDGTRFEQGLRLRSDGLRGWDRVLGSCCSVDSAHFTAASFGSDAVFARANFLRDISFFQSRFAAGVTFYGARFDASVDLEEVAVAKTLLSHASFRQAPQLGPVRVGRTVSLDRSSIDKPLQIKISASRVTCHETRFGAGVDLRTRWANIVADGADLAGRR